LSELRRIAVSLATSTTCGAFVAFASAVASAQSAPSAGVDLLAKQPVESIELVCLEHLDLGFTASPQEVTRFQKDHLDHAIRLCEERPDFRWTVESRFQVEEWLARTEERDHGRLVALVRAGRIELGGALANFHTGVMDESLLQRAFDGTAALRAKLGVEIDCAVQDDVPGFAAQWPAALKRGGISCFLAGVNTSFGGGTTLAPGKDPFWWQARGGERVLTWVAPGSYVEAENWGLGVWSPDGDAESKLPQRLAEWTAAGYARPRLLVMASTGDNGDPEAALSILRKVDAWNKNHARPRVRFTTPGAFLTSLLKEAGADSFPVFRGDWSGHWEAVKATGPAATALYRDAQALLPAAEALAARAQIELQLPSRRTDLDDALRKLLLFSEHSQPGGVGWPKLTTKAQVEAANQFSYALAFDAHSTVHGVLQQTLARYADSWRKHGAGLLVFNPLSFARGGLVEATLADETLKRPFRLLAPDGRAVECEIDAEQRLVRFLAAEIAPLGFASYTLQLPAGDGPADPAPAPGPAAGDASNAPRLLVARSGRVTSIVETRDPVRPLDWVDHRGPWSLGDLAWMRSFAAGGDLRRVDAQALALPNAPIDVEELAAAIPSERRGDVTEEWRVDWPGAPRREVRYRRLIGERAVAMRVRIDLAALERLHDLEEGGDPARLFLPLPLFELASLPGKPGAMHLSWTTSAGVESDADFLPGGRSRRRVTSGGLRIVLTVPPDEGVRETAYEATVLLREPFEFELDPPAWLGEPLDPVRPLLWIHLFDRARVGETKDRGRVEFERLEPAPDDLREFSLELSVRPLNGPADRCSDDELLRRAASFRTPLIAVELGRGL
jgi:hypothetical protein